MRGCVYAALGVATRTPQMKKDEAELMAKTPKELHALLAYLNSPVEAAITDKGVLAARACACAHVHMSIPMHVHMHTCAHA